MGEQIKFGKDTQKQAKNHWQDVIISKNKNNYIDKVLRYVCQVLFIGLHLNMFYLKSGPS